MLVGFGLVDIICEGIKLGVFHDSIMPVQYIRQRRNRRISWNVPRPACANSSLKVRAQLKFQIITHSVCWFIASGASCLAVPRVLAALHNFA